MDALVLVGWSVVLVGWLVGWLRFFSLFLLVLLGRPVKRQDQEGSKNGFLGWL